MIPPGEEQAARWYDNGPEEVAIVSDVLSTESNASPRSAVPRIVAHHFTIQPVSDPISDGITVEKYVDAGVKPRVKTRVVLHEFAMKLKGASY